MNNLNKKSAFGAGGGSVFTLVGLGVILWFGRPFLVPLAYAFMTALVLFPISKWLESKRFSRSAAIALPMSLTFLLFGGLLALLSYEMIIIGEKWPLIHRQLDPLTLRLQQELEMSTGWSAERQLTWLRDNLYQLSQHAGAYISETANALFAAVFHLILIPIYVALLLFYRGKLVRFVIEISPESLRDQMSDIINNTVKIFSRFIRGMLSVYLTVGLLNSVGLWLLGVENPFMYGMITAVMTIIPYFGIIISGLLPITLSWIETGSLWQPIGIVLVFSVVQYLEANVIFPYVVGKFVNLNTLAAIVSIFLGALFWGVSGMILFLPAFAVLRLIAEQIPEWKPLARLLGH